MNSQTHCFALHYDALSTHHSSTWRISTPDIVHRLAHVLRAEPDQTIILFNQQEHVICSLTTVTAKYVEVHVTSQAPNTILSPRITLWLPLLKRAAFEEAVYLATALGVQAIQIITTAKSLHTWRHEHDYARTLRIIIAAAEQSKHFAYPQLYAPQSLEALLSNHQDPLIVADLLGTPIKQVLSPLTNRSALTVLIGPEGDFTDNERAAIAAKDAYRCTLTPTVLRSEHAMAVLVGICRSLL